MSATYTIKNLRTVEDSAPQFGLSEVQEARFAQDELEASDTGFSFHVLKPDRRQPVRRTATSRPRRSTWCSAGRAG